LATSFVIAIEFAPLITFSAFSEARFRAKYIRRLIPWSNKEFAIIATKPNGEKGLRGSMPRHL
jgi:hypothetical protein